MEDKEKINKWYRLEGCDRAHTILCMMQELFGYCDKRGDFEDINLHPAIWNERCMEALSTATEAMADLYQAIGEYEEENDGV